jgi:hypothetical protein
VATDARARRVALVLAALYALVLAIVALVAHRTPLYQVETDLVGEYIPAANDLLHGRFSPEHYTSKGFGYPLLLAVATPLARGDGFLAARVINVVAAVAGAWLSYVLFTGLLGAWPALLVLLGLVVTPCYVQGAVEAGTDLPAFALSIAATVLVLRARRDGSARALLAAGALAGCAIITRSNSVFLVLAALLLLVFDSQPLSRIAIYLAGVAVPVLPWMIASLGVRGGMFGGQNVMNVAYEFHGAGAGMDEFWSENAARYHSLLDVVRQDPARFAAHLLGNLATRWFLHARRLLVLPLGWLAALGIAAGAWWRGVPRREGVAIALHFALCYAVLATVFYLPRFHIYLVPFYLSGAAWLVFALMSRRLFARDPVAARTAPAWTLPASLALGIALMLPSAYASIRDEAHLLAKAPDETRLAGAVLSTLGPADAGVMARKPHVAYFAHMRYVPFPDVTSYAELFRVARRDSADYLFYSSPEAGTRSRLLPLGSGNARLPGLEPVRAERIAPGHFYALYRFTGERVSPDSLEAAALELARQFAARRSDDPPSLFAYAVELIATKRYAEALQVLAVTHRLAPDWPAVPAEIARAESLARAR